MNNKFILHWYVWLWHLFRNTLSKKYNNTIQQKSVNSSHFGIKYI